MKEIRNKTYNFLRWGEKYTKTDNVYLAKGGFWLTLGHAIAVLSGLILTIGFANLISKETFGTYKFILSVSGILAAFSLTGMSSVVTRSVAKGFDGILKTGFLSNLKWSFLVFTGGLIGAIYYFLNDNTALAISVLIAGSISPFISSASLYAPFLEGKKDFRKQTFYGMFRNSIPALAILITIFFTDNPILIILTYFLSNVLAVLYFYYKTLNVYKPSNSTDPGGISYAKHLSLMNILGFLANQIDKVLVFHFLGAVPLAIYAFAMAPVDQLQAGKKFIKILALPKLSIKSPEEIKKIIPQKAFSVLLFSLMVTTIYIFLAPLFYKLLFPQYIESTIYSQIYALTLLSAPAMLFIEGLVAQQKKKGLYIIRTLAPIIRIALFLTLLPIYGIMGIIIALVLNKFIGTLITILVFKKYL